MQTVWVLGDQLHPERGALASADPSTTRVLLVTSRAQLAGRTWHRQRAHLVLSGMAHLAHDLRSRGFDVDERDDATLAAGLAAHRREHRPDRVLVMEPASFDGLGRLAELDVELVPNDQMLCGRRDFAAWAQGRRAIKMEDFYRWRRRVTGVLMDGDEPVGGRWNFDADNREPPPRDGRAWPAPTIEPLDEIDQQVVAKLGRLERDGTVRLFGAPPTGLWPTSRAAALRRLHQATVDVLPHFGPHEDAMLTDEWQMAHSLLSSSLNVGLLHPSEVVAAALDAYAAGRVPLASAEGFIRQVIGWREYVWGLYWLRMPGWRDVNFLDAHRPLPPAFRGAATQMACVRTALEGVHDRAYVHHIQRLMVLANLALISGVEPWALTEWMWSAFIDGAEWVMVPNVMGMALFADGGQTATKPYAAGGAYIDRMSDSCGRCRYDRRRRTGPEACPFTTLYWAFIDRHRDRFASNPRVAQQVRAADRLGDLADVRARAAELLGALDRGEL